MFWTIKKLKKLKAENETLKDANATLEHRFEEHRTSNITIKRDLIAKVERLETELATVNRKNSELRSEKTQLTVTLREQTEADILLNALKAVGIIKEDKPEKPDYFAENSRLNSQLSGIASMPGHNISNMFGGVFGGLR